MTILVKQPDVAVTFRDAIKKSAASEPKFSGAYSLAPSRPISTPLGFGEVLDGPIITPQ